MAQSELIGQMEAQLRRHGYQIAHTDGGRLTGETTDAIQAYQQAHGLERTGTPSEPLLTMMRNDNSPRRPAYQPTQAVPVAPVQAVQCADFLHQSRPGGTDYSGPPVPGCPSR